MYTLLKVSHLQRKVLFLTLQGQRQRSNGGVEHQKARKKMKRPLMGVIAVGTVGLPLLHFERGMEAGGQLQVSVLYECVLSFFLFPSLLQVACGMGGCVAQT